ncbi:hypothetical protein CAEBREN_07778 [Caenorhabditis brenneri]|uniref:Uncharacterized protein n=1 Tax=Caenorhabditis brenneri TaxID=135651 RepID=G0PAB9_CAEBE|nr:hypothetical protein CAEBREN_07778 [Caenorhabditis brenneri]
MHLSIQPLSLYVLLLDQPPVMSDGNPKQNSPPEIKPPNFPLFHPCSRPRPIQLPAPPPPPPPQATQFNYGARQDTSPSFYSPRQYHQRQYGNSHSVGGRYGNGPLPYPRPDNQRLNRQLMSDQQTAQENLRTGDLLTKKDKLLEEKNARIHELSANLEGVSQENDRLRKKLQEFGEMEAKKQELQLQEFNLEISKLEEAEVENLKDQLEEMEKSTKEAKEMVDLWEVCYYRDINNVLRQNEDKLEAQRASDQTFWMGQLNYMKNQYNAEMEKLQNKLKEAKNEAELASHWEKKYKELKNAWYVGLMMLLTISLE